MQGAILVGFKHGGNYLFGTDDINVTITVCQLEITIISNVG